MSVGCIAGVQLVYSGCIVGVHWVYGVLCTSANVWSCVSNSVCTMVYNMCTMVYNMCTQVVYLEPGCSLPQCLLPLCLHNQGHCLFVVHDMGCG